MEPSAPILLELLEKLLAFASTDFKASMAHAADLIAAHFGADKVDAFVHDASRNSLVAVGASNQPLSQKERALGLDVLPVANGGRVVGVFLTGVPTITGRLDEDPDELLGIREGLGVRSQIGVALEIGGARRGMIMVTSQARDAFTDADLRLLVVVTRWVGMTVHRAELAETVAKNAMEQGRRAMAEELVTILAHDLRNMLNPIVLRVETLRARASAQARTADLADADRIRAGLQRVTRLTSNLLDVAKIDGGVLTLDLRPVPLRPVLEETAARMAVPDVGVDIRMAEDIVLVADPERLEQLLENLFGNAVKHSPRGENVLVEARRVEGDDGAQVRIEVADQGPGIPPELMPRLFQRFGRGDRSVGVGLGLFLARQIARAHGGDLEVRISPARGARFILTVPVGT